MISGKLRIERMINYKNYIADFSKMSSKHKHATADFSLATVCNRLHNFLPNPLVVPT